MKTPGEIAAQKAHGWPEWHPEDYCHRCGQRNPPWVIDAHLWTVGAGLYDILCITCWVDAYQAATGETVCLRVAISADIQRREWETTPGMPDPSTIDKDYP